MKRILFIFGTRPEAIKLCSRHSLHADLESRTRRQSLCDGPAPRDAGPGAGVFRGAPGIRPGPDDSGSNPGPESPPGRSPRSTRCSKRYVRTWPSCRATPPPPWRAPWPRSTGTSLWRTWKPDCAPATSTHPFPEEMNRLVTGRLAALHFAPTAGARRNLLVEGVPGDRILVTGNSGIDAVLHVAAALEQGRLARARVALAGHIEEADRGDGAPAGELRRRLRAHLRRSRPAGADGPMCKLCIRSTAIPTSSTRSRGCSKGASTSCSSIRWTTSRSST